MGDNVMGSFRTNRPPRGRRLGRGRGFRTFRLVRRWFRHESGGIERIAWPLTGSVCSFIVRSIPEGLMFREFSSIWEIQAYMEAYEASGYLQPVMVRVILRSMADLDQLITTTPVREFSTEDYAKCVGQLHQIICSSQNGNGAYPPPLDPRSLEQSSGNLGDSHQFNGGGLQGKAGVNQEQPGAQVKKAQICDG